ncbi:hypothetical protein CUMW_270170 [Citrus unshiu]|uniref:RNase H type-1 domain-containing protein n=1 Tax=Citrus unshiu TaxID=55188 RepID=A0A2H5QX83_CITUN|nr:hypothetical protein CUMW_270170 [Citrus unshiu]
MGFSNVGGFWPEKLLAPPDRWLCSQAHKLSAHGSFAHGLSAHGLSTHGLSAHGSSAHRLSAHGSSAHELSTHGSSAHGLSAHGSSAHEFPAHGSKWWQIIGGAIPPRQRSKLTNNSSYILRSLLWGRKILKIGSRWLVGEGKDILVYYHNWIPRPCTFRPASPHTLPSDTTVATLLKENGGWNEELIRTHFLPVDTAAILKILVPTMPLRDELLWHFNQSGVYSVKSGYQLDTWHPPDPPWYKLNTDAAVDMEGGFARLGSIIRNYQGEVMATATSKKPCLGDVEIAEAYTILEGIKLAADVALSPLLVESDSKNVAYTPRSCNLMAHGLAKTAMSVRNLKCGLKRSRQRFKTYCNCFVLVE